MYQIRNCPHGRQRSTDFAALVEQILGLQNLPILFQCVSRYVFGLLFTDACLDYLREPGKSDDPLSPHKHFGSVSVSWHRSCDESATKRREIRFQSGLKFKDECTQLEESKLQEQKTNEPIIYTLYTLYMWLLFGQNSSVFDEIHRHPWGPCSAQSQMALTGVKRWKLWNQWVTSGFGSSTFTLHSSVSWQRKQKPGWQRTGGSFFYRPRRFDD